MTRYQVDSEAVAAATIRVRSTIERIQTEVSAMQGCLADLQSTWSGEASTAFQGVVGEWKTTQQRVEENLAAINNGLDQAARGYAETETAAARLFRV